MCQLGNSLSQPISVLSGVPQGSVIGPTLLLLFVNDVIDIFDNLAVSFKLYADDIKLYFVIILHHPVTIYLLLSIDYMTGALPGS